MKISKAIETLEKIKAKYGDLTIIGGYLLDDTPLREISVLETEGGEIWPRNINGVDLKKAKVDGVFLT